MTRVYLAGPIQHAPDNGTGWREYVKETYAHPQWIDPLDSYDHATEAWTPGQIVTKDLSLIDSADALLVRWSEVPTAGTPMEIFYASRCNRIPVAVVFTLDGISPWIEHHADVVCETVDEAVAWLRGVEG